MAERALTTGPGARRALDAGSARNGPCAVVAPSGEIDVCAAPMFRDALLAAREHGCDRLVVDLSDVSFIDAAALGVIVGVARDLGPEAVALVVPHENLATTFKICGLERVLGIYSSRDEALAAQATSATAGLPADGRPTGSSVGPPASHIRRRSDLPSSQGAA